MATNPDRPRPAGSAGRIRRLAEELAEEGFTFFHEAAHILEHNRGIIFLDEWDHGGVSAEEQRADRFAADLLIPPQHAPELAALRSADSVRAFAAVVGVDPGIVVGRLQHDAILPHTHLNSLKERIDWNHGPAS